MRAATPRIAFLRQRWHADGGAERFVAATIAELANRGISTVLVTRSWPETKATVVRCDPPYLGRLWRDAGFQRAARRALRGFDVDLVQSHERIPGCDVYRAGDGVHREWLEQRSRILGPVPRLLLGLSPWHRFTLRSERKMFEDPRLRAVICNSAMVQAGIARSFAIDPTKLHVIPTGVDLERFHPRGRSHGPEVRKRLGIPSPALIALLVGSGFERKGVAFAIEAVARTDPEWHLVVAGGDRRLSSYAALARRQNVAGRVHLLGPVADVVPLLGAADAFVLPTLYDPLPNAALEALAAGLPTITSPKSGAADLVLAGGAGFVVDPLDTAGIAARLRDLKNPDTRGRLGTAARRCVEPYTVARAQEELLALYTSLLQDRLDAG